MSKFVRGLKLMGGSLKNIWKGSKTGKGLIIITALLMIGGCSGEESYTPEQYDELVSGYEQQIEDLEKEVNEQKGYVKNWKGKVNDLETKTKDYLELDDNEKEIVDAKIVEVNQATEEQIAAEKAQKEAEEKAKKEEEERKKAEEEAARKAEEERKAQEEAEKRAAEAPYIEAVVYLKNQSSQAGGNFNITRDGNTIYIESVTSGSTSVSDLKDLGLDDATIVEMASYQNVRDSAQFLASTSQSEVRSKYASDINVVVSVKIAGEECYRVNGNGTVLYDILK